MRGDRPTRLVIDPGDAAGDGCREEAIEWPDRWLRGLLGLQAAMTLPMRRVPLGREGLYNLLAFLARHRAAKGPRAIRFELTPGRPAALVLEPWGRRIEAHGGLYEGPKAETIRVRGRDRLRPLAGVLPGLDGADVFLLGDGLPSFWSARMGGVRLLLGLPGRPLADRLGEPNLARLAPPVEPGRYLASRVAAGLRAEPAQSLAKVAAAAGGTEAEALAALYRLAEAGRVAHDPAAGLYRRRALTPSPISADRLGPEDPEAVAAREIASTRSVRVVVDQTRPDGLRVLEGLVLERPAALTLDADGRLLRGRCTCSDHRPAASATAPAATSGRSTRWPPPASNDRRRSRPGSPRSAADRRPTHAGRWTVDRGRRGPASSISVNFR